MEANDTEASPARPKRKRVLAAKVVEAVASSSSSSSSSSSARGAKGKASRPNKKVVAGAAERKLPELTPEELKSVFHMPIREAAKKMGYGQTRFKEICRELGVGNWPSRQIQALQRHLDKIQTAASRKGSLDLTEKELYDAEVAKLQAAIKEVSEAALRSPSEESATAREIMKASQACSAATTQEATSESEGAGVGGEGGDEKNPEVWPERKKSKRGTFVSHLRKEANKFLGEIKAEDTTTASSSSSSSTSTVAPLAPPVTAVLASTNNTQTKNRVQTVKTSAATTSTLFRKGWFPANNNKIGGIANEVIDSWGTVQAKIERKFDYFSGEGTGRTIANRALGEPREYYTYVPGTVVVPPLPASMNIAQKSGNIILVEPRICGLMESSIANFVPRLTARKF